MTAPEEIHNVSQSQFSIARHYGGCTYQGAGYHYDAERDVLIRLDVWQRRLKEDREAARQIKRSERAKWMATQEKLL